MILNKKHIGFILILIPFILVFAGEAIQNLNKPLSTHFKLVAFIYMTVYVLFRKFNIQILFYTLILLLLLVYHLFIAFNPSAAVEEFIRYLFPVVTLFYGYSIRQYAKPLIMVFIYFVIINDLWQIINYINWIRGVDQWFYYDYNGVKYYNAVMGILRATGLVTFFALFGFINAVAFFLIYFYYNGRWKKIFLWITTVSILASISYKTIGVFIFLLFLLSKNKLKIITVTLLFLIFGTILFPEKAQGVVNNLNERIAYYFTVGNSARAESYRVMFEYTPLLKGYGIGSFGGPVSVKYNSPLYEEFDFNWYGMHYLTTTDTFYPHLFIEVGFVTAVLYLLFIMLPLFNRLPLGKQKAIYAIYALLLSDAFFSFSLNHLGYLMSSVTLIFPLIYLEIQKAKEKDHNQL